VLPADTALASYMVLRSLESLVHAAILEPPPGVPLSAVEDAIVDMIAGYLVGRGGRGQ